MSEGDASVTNMRSLCGVPVVAALMVALLTSCGRDAGRGGTGDLDGVPPREWAVAVCAALRPWTDQIATLTRQAQERLAAAAGPDEARASVLELLDGARQASATARDRVAAAGIPDIEQGERVAQEFLASLTAARDAYAAAHDEIESLSTADATAFYDGVEAAMQTLDQRYRQSAVDTSTLSSTELQRAFDEVPECQ